MQVHHRLFQSSRVTRIILLALSSVDEACRKLVAVLGVVAAAAPLPVAAYRRRCGGLGPSHVPAGRSPSTAAARRDTTFATVSAHAVHDAGRQGRVQQRRLSAACIIINQSINQPISQSISQSVTNLQVAELLKCWTDQHFIS